MPNYKGTPSNLKRGDNPGPHPGSGTTTRKVRDACRLAFDERLPKLCEIFDNENNSPNERARVMELLAKTGVGEKVSVEFTNEEVFARIASVTAEFMAAEHFDGWYRRCCLALQES